MPALVGAAPAAESSIRREAKLVGLRSFAMPSMEDVERRRMQLWVVTAVIMLAVSAVVVLVSTFPDEASARLQSPTVVRLGFLGLIAGFAAYALEKELHLRRLSRLLIDERVLSAALTNRVREISTLLEAGRAVNSACELSHVLDTILQAALELLDASSGTVLLADAIGNLSLVNQVGDPASFNESLEPVAARVAESREPALLDSDGTGAKAMTVPLIDRHEVIGVLHIAASDERRFTEFDLRAVGLFGEHAATAVSKARLYDAARQHAGQLSHLAYHDPLTDLANRSLFAKRTQQAISRATRQGSTAALLFVDLDDFKTVNDSLGHASGDRLLVAVARRLGECLRKEDTAARLGGDEFGLLIEDVGGGEGPAKLAQRVLAALREPFAVGEHEVFLSASIGIALAGEHGDNFDELLRNADLAMYEAKESGKGSFHFFEQPMYQAARSRLEREGDLQRAVARGEIEVHYQTAVQVGTGEVLGVEALIRWRHPLKGLLGPLDFVPAAVDNGLIVPIGDWVLEQSCRQLREWWDTFGDDAPQYVAVNVAARQLMPSLVARVKQLLETYGLPGSALSFELTEDQIVRDLDASIEILEGLRKLGVQVAIDDFGTGYSSLAYLLRLPVDRIKVDKSFVDRVADDEQSRALVGVMIELGRRLKIDLIAEGVERAEQQDALVELGCLSAQGFLFSRPVPAAELTRQLNSTLAERAVQASLAQLLEH